MSKRLVCFSLSLAAALAAMVMQLSPPPAAAQRPLPDEPAQECRECDGRCTLAYRACAAEVGGRGPGFGRCVREQQECRRACHARGGPCDAPTGPTPTPVDSPTPMPTPTPD